MYVKIEKLSKGVLSKWIYNMLKVEVEEIEQIISGRENETTEFKECTDKVNNSVYVYCIWNKCDGRKSW